MVKCAIQYKIVISLINLDEGLIWPNSSTVAANEQTVSHKDCHHFQDVLE